LEDQKSGDVPKVLGNEVSANIHSINDANLFLSEFNVDQEAQAVGNCKVQTRDDAQEKANSYKQGVQQAKEKEREKQIESMEDVG